MKTNRFTLLLFLSLGLLGCEERIDAPSDGKGTLYVINSQMCSLDSLHSVRVFASSPEKGVIGSPDDITDGTWIWPADLVYYVENYDLQLDEEFIKHMAKQSWSVPEDLIIDEDDIDVV